MVLVLGGCRSGYDYIVAATGLVEPPATGSNQVDECPLDDTKTSPGACGCGVPDVDSDSDGALDCDDGCPDDADKTEPGACGCGVSDVDGDTDAVADCNDGCPDDADKTEPGACGCGVLDVDSDGDTVADCNDGCPDDAARTAPGACGCGTPDMDSDGDTVLDCDDGCPMDPSKSAPGACGCGVSDIDSDGDGSADCNDGCPSDGTKTAAGTCGCAVPDDDGDGDGVADCVDGCPADNVKDAPGVCGCGVADTDLDDNSIIDCNEQGVVDATFGIGGEFTYPSNLGSDVFLDAVTIADGSIFLAGYMSNGSDIDVLLMKITPDGVLDTSFNGTGFITRGELAGGTARTDHADTISFAADGDLLIGGRSQNAAGARQGFLWKVSVDGVDDPNFGNAGIFLLDATFGLGQTFTASPDPVSGNIFIVAARSGTSAWRVLADGSGLDTSFSDDGYLNLHTGAIQPRMANDAAGNLFVAAAATTGVGAARDLVSWRVDTDGTVSAAYGDPLIHADLGGVGSDESWRDCAVYDADRILLLGTTGTASEASNEVIARVNIADGSLDATFGGGDGIWVEDSLGLGTLGRADDVVVEPDGSMVVALEVRGLDNDFDAALIKLDANGVRDLNYAAGAGFLMFGGDFDERLPRLVRQPSGRKLLLTQRRDATGIDVSVWAIR